MSFAEFETRISDSAAIRGAVFERAAGRLPAADVIERADLLAGSTRFKQGLWPTGQ